jgi:hypothetical protein
MRDVIRLASHAYHYLTIFDDAGRPLYLGKTKRLASAGQRIVLHVKDRGCSAPGCTAPGYQCEVHHVDQWAAGGRTDIDDLTFACRPDSPTPQTRRLEDSQTPRRHHRMDPTTPTRNTGWHQRLPPPRKLPAG